MKFIDKLRTVKARTPQEQQVLTLLITREMEREKSGLNALMEKFTTARDLGLALNERDSDVLLALLLDDRLKGIGNYP